VAEIRPFRGVHYSRTYKDWSEIICPPYDIISPQQQEELYLRNDYNFIRLESGRDLPQDTATDSKYTRSAAIFQQWLDEGILETEETPSLYLHDHSFMRRGRKYTRRSIIASVRLEEWDRMVIRPHEGTLTEARGDRLSLLWALQANTSPILAMYEDTGTQISSLLNTAAGEKPFISMKDNEGESHKLWIINDTGVTDKISKVLSNKPLYIADGHHRYESALAYRREKLAYSRTEPDHDPYNYVMMSLVDFSDPGLIILAPHRLVRGIPKPTIDEFFTKLRSLFQIEEMPLKTPDIWLRLEDTLSHSSKIRIVLFGTDTDNVHILTLQDQEAVSEMIPYFHSELYKGLDVSIVDHVILENLLALSSEKEKTGLAYSYDMADAVGKVLTQEYQLAILLSPVRPEMIKMIADAGDKMPRKSTYFYPKSPSGLIVHRLDRA
jgi:uncharacterized protein (DUF1015 family)